MNDQTQTQTEIRCGCAPIWYENQLLDIDNSRCEVPAHHSEEDLADRYDRDPNEWRVDLNFAG